MTLTIAHLLLGNVLGISKEKAPRNILKLFKVLPWLLVNLRNFTNTVDVSIRLCREIPMVGYLSGTELYG